MVTPVVGAVGVLGDEHPSGLAGNRVDIPSSVPREADEHQQQNSVAVGRKKMTFLLWFLNSCCLSLAVIWQDICSTHQMAGKPNQLCIRLAPPLSIPAAAQVFYQ